MDEIISGGKAFKEAWLATPKARRRVITKAVQGGKEVTEETEIAAGYAQRQIKTSWAGYIGIIALAFVINLIQGEDVAGNSLTWAILGVIVLIAIYSYRQLFRAKAKNLALLESKASQEPDAQADETGSDGAEAVEISRLQAEGGPVTEVPEVHPQTPPMPATPSAPTGDEGERTTGE